MQKLKLNDEVIILAGKDKGKTGVLTRLNVKGKKAWVKGINVLKKAVKPTQENPNGGLMDIEGSVHLSNVALVSPKTKKSTRVRIEEREGKKVRVAVSCGSVID